MVEQRAIGLLLYHFFPCRPQDHTQDNSIPVQAAQCSDVTMQEDALAVFHVMGLGIVEYKFLFFLVNKGGTNTY